MIDEYTGKKIVSPLDLPENHFNYRTAYIEMREVFDSPLFLKMMIFTRSNPEIVFPDDPEIQDEIRAGYLDTLISCTGPYSLDIRTAIDTGL